jgi:phosphoribosylformylglycinamidine cyclo-ligase
MVEACAANGCALLGGETADMPDVYREGDYDLAGFIIGIVERDAIIHGKDIAPGDVLLGLPSNGLHTNGYSLVRNIFNIGKGAPPEQERAVLDRYYDELGTTLGEALLRPHPSYFQDVRPLLKHVKGIAHITGGGLVDNVPRILPDGVAARFERGTWPVPPVFGLIQQVGAVAETDMLRTFNMGVGMVLVVAAKDAEAVRAAIPSALQIGSVVNRAAGAPVEFV